MIASRPIDIAVVPVSFRDLVPEITTSAYLTHGLYYYPAKFIPHAVRYCLQQYTQPGDTVVDPFAGSGTVGLEACLCGRRAFLLDLNYLLDHIIPLKIYQGRLALSPAVLEERLHAIFSGDSEFHPHWNTIAYWYAPEILAGLQRLWGAQKQLPHDTYALILEAALLKVSKHYSYAEHRLPKLFRSKSKRLYIDGLLQGDWQSRLHRQLRTQAQNILIDINGLVEMFNGSVPALVHQGGVDSGSYEFRPGMEFHALISSPPYLQAQEYVRTFKLDLYWLGYKQRDIQRITALEIPYRKATRIVETHTLNAVRTRLSNAKLSAMLDSYFCHTLNVFDNAMAQLVRGGRACIFIGNPRVDGLEVEIWRVFMEYFADRGFDCETVLEDRIKARQLFSARKNKNPDGMKSEFMLILRKQ